MGSDLREARRDFEALYARTMAALARLEQLSLNLDDKEGRWGNLAVSMRGVIAQEREQIAQKFHP